MYRIHGSDLPFFLCSIMVLRLIQSVFCKCKLDLFLHLFKMLKCSNAKIVPIRIRHSLGCYTASYIKCTMCSVIAYISCILESKLKLEYFNEYSWILEHCNNLSNPFSKNGTFFTQNWNVYGLMCTLAVCILHKVYYYHLKLNKTL